MYSKMAFIFILILTFLYIGYSFFNSVSNLLNTTQTNVKKAELFLK